MNHIEAMKQALEALKNVTVTGPDDDGLVWINLPGNGTTGKAILRVGKAGLIAAQCAKLYEEQRTKAITAIKQALALDKKAENARELGLDYEPVWDNLPSNKDVEDAMRMKRLNQLATPPAAQRQWVGLDWLPEHKCGLHLSHNEHRDVYETVEQFYDADDFISEEEWRKAIAEDSVWVLHWYPNTPIGFTRIAASTLEAIEAELKEKNGLHRQHVIDGSPCWCEPETSYTDPETGASVVVHKEPQ